MVISSQSYSLTELTKNYMGMFRVDNKQKALIVTNEVDCCTRIEERYRYNHDGIVWCRSTPVQSIPL